MLPIITRFNSVSAEDSQSSLEKEKQEDEHFQKVYEKWKGIDTKITDQTYKVIPKFYFKV